MAAVDLVVVWEGVLAVALARWPRGTVAAALAAAVLAGELGGALVPFRPPLRLRPPPRPRLRPQHQPRRLRPLDPMAPLGLPRPEKKARQQMR